jgi:hypothetical protein
LRLCLRTPSDRQEKWDRQPKAGFHQPA